LRNVLLIFYLIRRIVAQILLRDSCSLHLAACGFLSSAFYASWRRTDAGFY